LHICFAIFAKMDLNTLSLFVESARRRSFSAVARSRDLEPSSISRAIATLEAEIGARLFQRTTRSLELTEAGRLYLERVEPLLGELEAARSAAIEHTRRPAGRLRISCPLAFSVFLLAPILGVFRRTYPQITLDVVSSDSEIDLVAERIDVAIRLGPRREAGYVGTKLFPTRYRVVASPAYLNHAEPPKSPLELSKHPCLVFDSPGYRDQWLFRAQTGEVERVAVWGAIVFSNAFALHAAAVGGAGPALVADWKMRNELADGRLVDLFPDHDVATSDFDTAAWLLYPSRAQLPAKSRVFIDFLRAQLAKR
jgi:DNA-binding transcriptional LysR family regulator